MKKDITPFYLETPYETLTGSGAVYPSGDTSFVIISGLTGNMIIDLPIRNSNDKPIKPGTCIRFFRTDNTLFSCGLASAKLNPGSTFYDSGIAIDLIVKNGESCTAMMMGPTETNKQGEWALIDSDLAGSDSWNGGAVTSDTTFSSSVNLNGFTKIGNSPVNDLQIASNFRFSDSNNNPTIVVTTGSGTATLNASAHPNAAIISFSGVWANGNTAVITLPSGVTFESERFILKNQPSTINGSIAVTTDTQITFTASGTCSGNLGYLVIVMGS